MNRATNDYSKLSVDETLKFLHSDAESGLNAADAASRVFPKISSAR